MLIDLCAQHQVYQRFVEIGRVALVNYGPDAGNLVAILDILDQNRILVQGPSVHRQVLNMKRATLTDLKVVIGRQARYVNLTEISSFLISACCAKCNCYQSFFVCAFDECGTVPVRVHYQAPGHSSYFLHFSVNLSRSESNLHALRLESEFMFCLQSNSTATLNAAWKAADTENKWNTSAWAKKLAAQKTRASLSDLDRFKLMVARKQVP
jgi:ribosomal protein L14E/L6E/L27E